MAKGYKIAGQSAPAADTDTTIYTVPAGKSFVSSSLTICNRDTQYAGAFRVAVVPSGASLANQHYIVFDKPVAPEDFLALVLGLTLAQGDKIVVRGSTANLSFNLFGSENS
jgi:hypothetical protein